MKKFTDELNPQYLKYLNDNDEFDFLPKSESESNQKSIEEKLPEYKNFL